VLSSQALKYPGGLLSTLLCLLAGCTVGPNYRQPDYPVPPAFRGVAPDAETNVASLGDLAWWQMFQDEQLQALLRTALTQNYDLRIAATRILDARAQWTSARSQQFPAVEANVRPPYNYTGGNIVPLTTRESFAPVSGLDLSCEIDFWGRLRRTTEAA
jgi:outer membrane protein, multidrug efflux system